MDIFHAAILGIVEGITEFLPVSSTFHLIFTSRLLSIPDTDFVKMFEVVIQAGAIGALVFMYTRTLLTNRNLLLRVILSFIPTAVIGMVLYKIIKHVFFTTDNLMLVMFVLIAIVFLGIEYLIKQKKLNLTKNLAELTIPQALLIGVAQSLAVIPGVSRSGSVLSAMMGMGYRRDEAAKYTFLLSMPTIFAASALDLWKSRELLSSTATNIMPLLVGFLVSFVVAYAVVRWLLKYLESHTLHIFAYYRLIVAALLILLLYK